MHILVLTVVWIFCEHAIVHCDTFVGCYNSPALTQVNTSFYADHGNVRRNGFHQSSAQTICGDVCRDDLKKTFYGLTKLGKDATYARCYCGDVPTGEEQGTSACSYTCEGHTCGGPSRRMSVRSVCPLGTSGPSCQTPCRGHCTKDVCNIRTGGCDDGCVRGWYGPDCDCTNCQDGCDQHTGRCGTCIYGWYTDKCSQTCLENCKNSVCDHTTGHCISCTDGRYGQMCTNVCANCQGACDQYTGRCTTCGNGWYTDKCDQSCQGNCYKSICDRTTGQCTRCTDGWYGQMCTSNCTNCFYEKCEKDSGQCTTPQCKFGWFGNKCDKQCSPQCSHQICDYDNGTCSHGCNIGWYGSQCDKPCSTNCKDGTCDVFTGNCQNGCKKAFYGPQCKNACSKGCLNKNCDDKNGHCSDGCVNGHYGQRCGQKCSSGCVNKSCNSTSGYCLGSCEAGFHGKTCKSECPLNCLNGTCDKSSSACATGCESGWSGTTCEEELGGIMCEKGPWNAVWLGPTIAAVFLVGLLFGALGSVLCMRHCITMKRSTLPSPNEPTDSQSTSPEILSAVPVTGPTTASSAAAVDDSEYLEPMAMVSTLYEEVNEIRSTKHPNVSSDDAPYSEIEQEYEHTKRCVPLPPMVYSKLK